MLPNDRIQLRLALPEFYDEQEVEDAIVELYEALNDLHRAEGGSGLKVEEACDEQ